MNLSTLNKYFSDGSIENQNEADSERLNQLKKISLFSSSFYVLPLFLIFFIADFKYYRSRAYIFLVFRVLTVLSVKIISKLIRKQTNLSAIQAYCTLLIFVCSAPLNVILYIINNPDSQYYVGLILVLIGMSMGFRFKWKYYFLNIFITISPYLLFGFVKYLKYDNFFQLSVFFILSVSLISIVSRINNEMTANSELDLKIKLREEIKSRTQVIKKKTEEARLLSSFAKQFSPQVEASLRDGTLSIDKDKVRRKICAIFIDVVDSTERLVNLDPDDYMSAMDLFMQDSMTILLKNGVTLDKPLGDGILAFSNAPTNQESFIEKVIDSAIEIRESIRKKQDIYISHWKTEFKLRFGIDTSYAAVGFHASEFIASYTATGNCINRAKRITDQCDPNAIHISDDVYKEILQGKYEMTELPYRTYKGWGKNLYKAYSVDRKIGTSSKDDVNCPRGHGPLVLERNTKHIFVFQCLECGYELDLLDQGKKA